MDETIFVQKIEMLDNGDNIHSLAKIGIGNHGEKLKEYVIPKEQLDKFVEGKNNNQKVVLSTPLSTVEDIDYILTGFMNDVVAYEKGDPVNLDLSFKQASEKLVALHDRQYPKFTGECDIDNENVIELTFAGTRVSLLSHMIDVSGDMKLITIKEV